MKKKTILVTGASKGIGQAIAVRLAKDGFHILVHYGQDAIGAERTLSLIEEAGSSGCLTTFNTANRAQCKSAIEESIEHLGSLYGVVLNASITRDAAFPSMTGDEWDEVIDTNLNGFYNVLHPCIMPMISARQGGRIVAISSVSGVMGNRGQTNYASSKAGLIGAVKSLAIELAKRKITVNSIAPGIIETQMTKGLPADLVKNIVPMRRMGTTNEVASAVAYLCSEDAGYITRQVLSINGGMY